MDVIYKREENRFNKLFNRLNSMKHQFIVGLLLWSTAALGVVQPDLLDVRVCNHYKYRPDKEAGREIILTYRGNKNIAGAKVEIVSKKRK
ncbi:MAG: hypothetical protein LUD46_10460 [Parabacteroides sp.]|nr:hypothetical protein [Parabacteroides sp.]